MFNLSKKPKLYNTIQVPARIFFEVFNTGDYSLLGEGTPEQLQGAFYTIMDEYVRRTDNAKIIDAYKKSQRVQVIQLQIQAIDHILFVITYHKLTRDQRLHAINSLNAIEGAYVKFNIDKPILEEIQRVQVRVIGRLKNELNIEQATEKRLKGNLPTFERELAVICANLSIYLNNEITLAEFLEYRKLAADKSKPKNQ